MVSNQGVLVRSARIVLAIAVAVTVLYFALVMLERSGPSPVRPFGPNISVRNISVSPADATTTTTGNGQGGNGQGDNCQHNEQGHRCPSGT